MEKKPAYKQLEELFRERIASGTWSVGSKIPPVRVLAEEQGTNVFTVHKALSPLESEGLISRHPKTGSVVTRGSFRLACVGLYFSSSLMDEDNAFYRRLCEMLVSKLGECGCGHRLWLETLPQEANRLKGSQVESVMKAAADGSLQALIAPMVNSPAFDAFATLKIPTAFMSSGNAKGNVLMDVPQMVSKALSGLKAEGCRSVGLISNMRNPGAKELSHPYNELHAKFRSLAAELGMETREEWVKCPPDGEMAASQLRLGYGKFNELWSQTERPEGLLVYPDATARGVLMAALELGVAIPRDMKLAMHRHEEVETLCPRGALIVSSKVSDAANALIEIIKDILAGKEAEPRRVGFELKRGEALP